MRKQRRYEQNRRIPIKLSTAALISVIGPASAWTVGGYNGLLMYIAVYIFAKLIAAEIAALSVRNAIFAYRNAPWLLAFGGLIPLVYDSDIAFTVILPILFGSYEGAYWTGYHDIRRVFKNDGEDEDKSVMTFTRYEVFCTFLGALVAAWLKYTEYDTVLADPGLIAAIFALSAFILPWNKEILNPEKLEFGKSASKASIKMGKLVSQPFAIVQFVATNGMRFAALQQSVLWLGLLVAISEIAGHIVVEIKRAKKDKKDKDKIDIALWNYGYTVAFVGLCVMILGEIFEQFWYFVLGWFFTQGALRGVLRRLELRYADTALDQKSSDKEDIVPQIGLRERLKFRTHGITVLVLSVPAIILSSSNLVLLLLCFGTLCCALSLILPDKAKSLFGTS